MDRICFFLSISLTGICVTVRVAIIPNHTASCNRSCGAAYNENACMKCTVPCALKTRSSPPQFREYVFCNSRCCHRFRIRRIEFEVASKYKILASFPSTPSQPPSSTVSMFDYSQIARLALCFHVYIIYLHNSSVRFCCWIFRNNRFAVSSGFISVPDRTPRHPIQV